MLGPIDVGVYAEIISGGEGAAIAYGDIRAEGVASGFGQLAVFAGQSFGAGLSFGLRLGLRLGLGLRVRRWRDRFGSPGPTPVRSRWPILGLVIRGLPILGLPIRGLPIRGLPILGLRRLLRLLAVERRRVRLLAGIPRRRFTGRLDLTVAAAAAGLAVAVGLGIGSRVDDAVVMLGVLIVGLRRDTVPRRGRIPREPDVFLVNLVGVAANPALRAATVEVAMARRATMLLAMRPPARSPSICTLSHRPLASD